ncbi:MAG: hypothetical protein Q9203_003769 [Teloschistes exilis]
MSYGKKDEDADQAIVKVDRTSVFQEARLFNSSPISPRKCRILLTKIALLLFTGERFPTNEATSLFFGISKLFQNRDASLRQMVYLVIKELANTAEDVIMVTSSIMKDTSVGSDVLYKANAIRALCRIIDATTVQAIERLIKTAIVDKTPSVSSAALVSSYHLLPIARDVVRRWQSETQEAASSTKPSGGFSLSFSTSGSQQLQPSSTNYMTQYHAIGLLYQMRSHDRMALVKMVQQLGAPGAVKSAAGTVMLVRLAAKLIEDDQSLRKPMMQLLDGWLRHKSEMVNFEAAKAICDVQNVTDSEMTQAIHTLQLFLTSPRAVTKFAAVRILHHVASFRPQAAQQCNPDIEALISNSNRSIATFAITTLLKTGNESSVDRLMKQISGFMADITDEFKITIVEAIRTLCLKFPSKQAGMLAFLSGILRDEGGYEFKRSVVESMFDLIKFVPGSKEDALAHLCEFIEDCEFTKLAVRILHLIGVEGPKTPSPTKYIRYIYNRVVLENAIVRAAAVTALAKFGVGQKDPDVKSSVTVLLTRCLDDTDDEVRDRAVLNLRLMSEEDEMANRFIKNESMFSLSTFEHQLVMYVTANDKATFATAFDMSKIPIVSHEQALAEERTKKLTSATPTLKAPTTGSKKTQVNGNVDAAAEVAATAQKHSQSLTQIPELKSHGPLLRSSAAIELTESETEYVVSVIKHIFKEHIVLQYEIKNTLPEVVLEEVSVVATLSEEDESLEEDFIIPVAKLVTDQPGTAYASFKKIGEGPYPITTFTNTLRFTSKEIDPTTGEPDESGYDDEYQVEDVELLGSDYVTPAYAGSFDHIWEQTGANGDEAAETLQLSSTGSIADATEQLTKTLSLQPLDGTDVTLSTSTHTLKLYGKTLGGGKVAALVKMAYSAKSGVTTKITVRSEEEGVAALLVSSVNHPSVANSPLSKHTRYDGGDGEVTAQVDATYGQRSAFPGLDEAPDGDALYYGPASDGLEYLRMVRSEAKGVPNLLIAPKSPPTEDERIYRDYPRGYYADGAYTALPAALPGAQAGNVKAKQADRVPQEEYHLYLLKSFRTLRSLLHTTSAPPSPPSQSILATIAEVKESPVRKWRLHLLYTPPTTKLINQMDQEMVIAGLTALEKLLRWKTLEKETHVGAWSWCLLARCREVGQMGSEEVAVVRELGKKAKILVRALMAGLGLAEEKDSEVDGMNADEEEQQVESEQEPDACEERPNDSAETQSQDVTDRVPGDVQNTDAAPNGTNISSDVEVGGAGDPDCPPEGAAVGSSVVDGEVDDVATAKHRLLSTLEQSHDLSNRSSPSLHVQSMTTSKQQPPVHKVDKQSVHTPVPSQEDNNADPQVEDTAGNPVPLTTRIIATLDMIITVVGEVYGQRDLLAGRMAW